MARCLRNNGKALRPCTFPPRGFVSFPESVVGPPRERFGLGMRVPDASAGRVFGGDLIFRSGSC